MSEALPSLNWSKNEEESDPDFDEVDLEEALRPVATPTEKPNKPGLIARVAELAKRLNFLGELQSGKSSPLAATLKNGRTISLNKKVIQNKREYGKKGMLASAEAYEMLDEVSAVGAELLDMADADFAAKLGEPDVDKYIEELSVELDNLASEIAKQPPTPTKYGLREEIVNNATDQELAEAIAILKSKYGISKVYDSSSEGTLRDIEIEDIRNNSGDIMLLEDPAAIEALDLDVTSSVGWSSRMGLSMVTGYHGWVSDGYVPDADGVLSRKSFPAVYIRDMAFSALLLSREGNAVKKINELSEKHKVRRDLEGKLSVLAAQIASVQVDRNRHVRDFILKYLDEAGVTMDSVSISDFRAAMAPGWSISENLKNGKDVLESWNYLPRPLLLAIRDRADGGRKIKFDYRSGQGGFYSPSENKVVFGTASTALHEQGHMIEGLVPTIAYLEHALLSRRIERKLERDGKGDVMTLQNAGVKGSDSLGSHAGLADLSFAGSYSAKYYPTDSHLNKFGGDYGFGPAGFFEVFTTGLEDLFTEVGHYSDAGGHQVYLGSGANSQLVPNAYKDVTTGFWYRDSSKSERIYPSKVYGRTYAEGQDRELRSFILGTLMMLNDWN